MMPLSYKQCQRRDRIHKHNSFFGHVSMARKNMLAIQQSDTATGESRRLAYEVEMRLDQLNQSLKTRLDQLPETTQGA